MTGAHARVRVLVAAARRLADPRDPLGEEARRTLPEATGLSPEGVELSLSRSLETNPEDSEIDALCASVPSAPRAHVLLGANVFVAAHRAIALALAASPAVFVRPSRREREMARLLSSAAPGLFEVVAALAPAPGDLVFAYGRDETLDALREDLPRGVELLAYGSGFGLAVVDAATEEVSSRLDDVARACAIDVAAFDQRGCLSPRAVLVLGPREGARRFAVSLAAALSAMEIQVPLGRVEPEEIEAAVRYRDTWLVAGEVFPAGRGAVGLDDHTRPLAVPPSGRFVHVRWTPDLDAIGAEWRSQVTAVGIAGDAGLAARVRAPFPGARVSALGEMQSPAFDGPVDRRNTSDGRRSEGDPPR